VAKKKDFWKASGEALNAFIVAKIKADEEVGATEIALRQARLKAQVQMDDALAKLREDAGVPEGLAVSHDGARTFVEVDPSEVPK
jgi:hypothetical protein